MTMGKVESVVLYLLIYLTSSLFFALSVRAKRGGSPFFVLAILIPVIFAAVRYQVGTDFGSYLNRYQHLTACSFADFLSSENILSNIAIFMIAKISMFCGGSQTFFGIYALLAYLPVALTVKKEYRAMSGVLVTFLFFTGLFTDGLNALRQVAAVSLCFYGLRFVYSRQLWRYIGTVAVAALFHTSAVIALVIYFLWDKDKQKVSLYASVLTICGTVLTAFTFRSILQVLTQLSIFSHYSIYIEDATRTNNHLALVHLALYIILFMIRRQMNALDKRNSLLYLLTFIGIVLEFTGFSLIYAKRIAMYFYEIPSVILIAQTPMLFRNKSRLVVYIGVLLFAVSLFIIRYAVLGHADVIPYRT